MTTILQLHNHYDIVVLIYIHTIIIILKIGQANLEDKSKTKWTKKVLW